MAYKRRMMVLAIMAITMAATLITWSPMTARGVVAEPLLIAADGTRFVRPDGTSIFLLGANYVGGADRSWTMWEDGKFEAGLLEQDFLRARAAGLNTLRIFIRLPLRQELSYGRTDKLDTAVALAEKYGLHLIITLYDYHEEDLAKAVIASQTIARRYAGRQAVLAYDLKNEPHYQDLAIARYPGSLPPLQTDVLVRHYGERMRQDEVKEWRSSGSGRNMIPSRFSDAEAYTYANNYRIYQEFLKEAGEWVAAKNYRSSSLDYMDSPDAARWATLLVSLDQTLSAWMAPQIEAIRAHDKEHLITIGYSDGLLAKLPANKKLDFISYHRFPQVGLNNLNATFGLLDNLRRSFPDKAITFEEFGYSNDGPDPTVTAAYETATMLHLISQGMAGGAKWSLFDVFQGGDARESNFGLYRTDGNGKPIVQALRILGEYVAASPRPAGKLSLQADPSGAGLHYVYSAPDALFVGAPAYSDPQGRLSYEAPGMAQVFVSWPQANVIQVTSTVATKLRLNPRTLLGVKGVAEASLQKADGAPVPLLPQGEAVVFDAEEGHSYRLSIKPLP